MKLHQHLHVLYVVERCRVDCGWANNNIIATEGGERGGGDIATMIHIIYLAWSSTFIANLRSPHSKIDIQIEILHSTVGSAFHWIQMMGKTKMSMMMTMKELFDNHHPIGGVSSHWSRP
jgi:hypothetical protein